MYRKADAYPPQRRASTPADSCLPSLFVPEISKEILLITFKLPNISYYNGEGNLEDHMHAFASAFHLYQASDVVMYRGFPCYLFGNGHK